MAKRYKRGDQSGKSKMDRKCNSQKIPTGNQRGKLKMNRQYNGQKIPKRKSKENGQTTIYKTKHKKPKMEQDEFQKGGLNSSAPEGLAVSALYVKPFIILLSETNSI
jgi:hypothetical protein